jgi:hypothetical protein
MEHTGKTEKEVHVYITKPKDFLLFDYLVVDKIHMGESLRVHKHSQKMYSVLFTFLETT